MSTQEQTSPKEVVKAGYDAISSQYLDFILSLPSPNVTWLDKLLHELGPKVKSAHVLELGCGNGLPCTKVLAEKVKHVTANDISEVQIRLARQKLAPSSSSSSNIDFIARDMTALEFAPETFDATVALYSIVHLPREEQPGMLASIHKWLKPGGVLLCNFDEVEDSGSYMDDWLGTRMFKSSFSAEQSKQMVADAGFELVQADVVSTVDGKKTVPFLWVLAAKKARRT